MFHTRSGLVEVGGEGFQVGGFVRSVALDKSGDGVMARRLGGGSQTGEDLNQLVGQSKRLGYPHMRMRHIFHAVKILCIQVYRGLYNS